MEEQTNQIRCTRAERLLGIYHSLTSEAAEWDEDIVTDVLADLMHYCRANQIDTVKTVENAYLHFHEEVLEEGHYATPGEIESARAMYQSCDLQIDNDARASRAEHHVWIEAWVYVRK